MRFFTTILTLFFSVLLVGQAQVEGVLTDENGNPIVGANLILQESRQGDATDAEGRYQIEQVKPGIYTLVATYVGYQEVRTQITVEEGASRVQQHLQLSQRIFNLDGLTVTATRAGEKTPMTYTNVGKEELEERNLGQDVPYILRWTPSAIVTAIEPTTARATLSTLSSTA